MKKSIKYAGIAAAALLTVAPIATPIASNVTTTVKAATISTQARNNAISSYNSALSNKTFATADDIPSMATTVKDVTSANYDKATGTFTLPYTTFAASGNAGNISASAISADSKAILESTSEPMYVKVSVKGVTGKTLAKAKEAIADIEADDEGYTFTVSYGYKTSADATTINPIDGSHTVTYAPTDQTSFKSAVLTYTTPLDVEEGSATDAVRYTSSSDVSIKTAKGVTVSGYNVVPDTSIYTSNTAAVKGSGTTYTNAKFNTADKTYYQRLNVTATAGSNLADFIKAYKAGTTGYKLSVNGSTVKAADVVALGDDSFVLIREINVKDDTTTPTDGWTYSDLNGVVTTGSKDVYTLKNDDNKDVANRALAGGTSWKTNSVRTNAAGEKQYRVATSEWINASDVTYKDSTTTPGTGISNIQNLTGTHVVSLDTPGFVYALYQQDGKTSSRYVAGGTSWATDQTGTDANGVVYYRVSTTEWVMAGQGVNFK